MSLCFGCCNQNYLEQVPPGRNMFLPAQGYAVPQTLRERLLLTDQLVRWVLEQLELANQPGHVRAAVTAAAKGAGGGQALWYGWQGGSAMPQYRAASGSAARPQAAPLFMPPVPPKAVQRAAPWDKLGLEGMLSPGEEPMQTVGFVPPKNPRSVPRSYNQTRQIKDADWPRLRGTTTNMLVRGCSGNNHLGIQVSLLPALAAHRGWCPVAVLAHAINLDVERTLAMVNDEEECVDNEGSQLFATSPDQRWVAPLVGSWQMALPGTAGSPDMRRYSEWVAGYPATHWIHSPPEAMVMGTYYPRPSHSSKKGGGGTGASGGYGPDPSNTGGAASSFT